MRNQMWVFICVGLLSGVMIEIMKAPAAHSVRIAGIKKLEAFLDEGSPIVGVANEETAPKKPFVQARPRFRPAAPPVPQPAEASGAIAPPKPLIAPTAPLDPKKKAEEDKKKAEEKKKKDAEDKKKKDEKEKKEAEEITAKQQEEQQQQQAADQQAADVKKAADDKAAAEQLDNPGQGPQNPRAAQAANTGYMNQPAAGATSETAAQWETYMMQNPTAAKTTQFVQYYKAGKITATTFYTVITATLASSNVTVREQGISALGQTPSAKSFAALSDEAGKETDPTAKSQAETDLQAYTSVANVVYLKAVISGTDQAAAIQAIDILKLSADTNLVASVGTTSTGSATSPAVSSATLTSSYTPFIAALTQLEQSTNASLRSLATETLTDLQSLLAPYQVTQN